MRLRFAALLIVLALLVPQTTTYARAINFSSIRVLQEDGRNICTTWSINQRERLYATANHCISARVDDEGQTIPPGEFTIDGYKAKVVDTNIPFDLAILRTERGLPALLKGDIPKPGDKVQVIGFAHGWSTPIVSGGTIAILWFTLPHHDYWAANMVFVMTIVPGHSGSPIFDEAGKVISLAQGMTIVGYGPSGIALGAPYDALVNFLGDRWEAKR